MAAVSSSTSSTTDLQGLGQQLRLQLELGSSGSALLAVYGGVGRAREAVVVWFEHGVGRGI